MSLETGHSNLAVLGAVLAYAVLVPALGAAKIIYLSGDTDSATWMDCARASDEPVIVAYSEEGHVTFKNMQAADLRDITIRRNQFRFPPSVNDKIDQFAVVGGVWKICADVNFEGRCSIFGRGTYTSDDIPNLAGKISSFKPVGCQNNSAATITMDVQALRRPNNRRSATTMCLSRGDSGIIANNGRVNLNWSNGDLLLRSNRDDNVLWRTNAAGDQVCFNSVGNLAITKDGASEIVWQTGHSASGRTQLVLGSDCNLKITKAGAAAWQAQTSCP